MAAKGLPSHLRRAFLTACVLLLAASPGEAAIVNSLTGFDEKEPGWSGSVGGSYGARGGNTEQTSLSADARLQWRGGAETWRWIGSAYRSSSGGDETARSLLGHLRHNHALGDRWATLAFVQAQENPFQRLESRFLAGAGLRWEAVRRESAQLSFGGALMHEREDIEATGVETRRRFSLFVTVAARLRDGVTFSGLGFFQPAASDAGDWRLMANSDLDVKLTANLSLFTGLDMEGDSRPPAGVEKVDWSTKTGLRWKF